MTQQLARSELVARYIRTAWILKIRLMSSRRFLWDTQSSLIHIESALLQIRKACESIGYLCVVAAELEHEIFDASMRKNYRVGAVLKYLSTRGALIFPGLARQAEVGKRGDQTIWQLDLATPEQVDIDKLGKLHSQCGQSLHEFSPYIELPTSQDQARQILARTLNQARGQHQWLWNRFWHHFIMIRGALLCVHLGDQSEASRPFVVKQDTLVKEELVIDLDVDFLADFTGTIDWNLYNPQSAN